MFWFIDLIFPVTMLMLSFLYKNKAKKQKISHISGFRTKLSMESEHNWIKAHNMAGRYLLCAGICLILYIIVIKLINPIKAEYLSLINVLISILIYIGITVFVNIKLRNGS